MPNDPFVVIKDDADKVPPVPPGKHPLAPISGADFERRSWRLPAQAWLVITLCALVPLLALLVALWRGFENLFLRWPWLGDATLVGLLAVFLVVIAGVAHGIYGWARAKAMHARVVRTRWGNPADVQQVLDMNPLTLETLHAQVEVAHAPYRQFPNLSTNTGGRAPEKPAETVPALPEPEQPPTLQEALLLMPRLVQYAALREHQPTRWSVPLGLDHTGAERWVDVRSQMLHAGIWGTTGTGKENLLQGWFVRLAQSNDPDSYQLFVLDGKGHWLQPKFAELAHMWHPPVGGVGETGDRALRAGLLALQTEMKRRGELVFGANCETDEQYEAVTGQRLPLLHVFISDVMSSVAGEIERTLIDLVSKARALGIRVVVSMQTPTGKEMAWRTNLSTVLCGALQDESQDAPALGIRNVNKLLFRPSQLPPGKERPGVFVARLGAEQMVIQTPYLSAEEFNLAISRLPKRTKPVQIITPATEPPSIDELLRRAVRAGKTRRETRVTLQSRGLGFRDEQWTEAERFVRSEKLNGVQIA